MTDMHFYDESTAERTWQIFGFALDRVRLDPRALELFTEELAPSSISTDHRRYLWFVPTAPSEPAVVFDVVVGASCLYGGSWLEGAGGVHAGNEALRWLLLPPVIVLPESTGPTRW